ncbi:hypothetical protein MRBLMN1_000570 [Chitinophaga ginsengisegetis]|uniref:hypothetical protein n=1 Tax=Chitinophaga ginsengisegetis TaxID=393003 RepID=UPI00342A0432
MTTSNKLLLGFSGVLVLLMLFSAILLKANYNKGITNTEKHQPQQDPDYAKVTLPAFKALVLKNTAAINEKHEATIYVRESPEYHLEFYKNATYNMSGDTLIVEISKSRDITLYAPAISYIDNRSDYSISLSDIKSPSLEINAGNDVRTFMISTKINSFAYTGGKNNTLEVNEDNILDSVKVTMDKRGSLYFYAPYQSGEFRVDSLDNLNITGKSLQSLKRIN